MPSFIDVSCPKCGRKHGWFGELKDRPACPGCKHQVPYSAEDEKHFEDMENLLRDRMLYADAEPTRLSACEWMWGYDSSLIDPREEADAIVSYRLEKRIFDKLEGYSELRPETEGLVAMKIYPTREDGLKALWKAIGMKPKLSDLMKKKNDT